MRIKYTGPDFIERSVGYYTWNAANHQVVDIPEGPLCADLLTANTEFKLAADEPLLKLMGENEIIELAIHSVDSISTLAALNSKGINRLAELTGKSVSQIRAWSKQAQSMEA
jgi:hypothetical protein